MALDRVHFLLFGLLIGLVTRLTACQPTPSCVIPVDTRASSLTVRFAEGTRCDRPAHLIIGVDFYREPVPGEAKVTWGISSHKFLGEQLPELQYGVVPEGFSSIKAAPLIAGETIHVRVQTDVSWGGGDIMLK